MTRPLDQPALLRPSWERWRRDVVLSDGTTGHIRPIEPDDAPAMVSFHERQSSESIYFRFFSPRPQLSDAEVAHLTAVDGVDRMAFVVERDDAVVGVGRYDRYPDRPVAEVAFFTDDEMGGRGIASLLLEYLAAYARDVGITGFEAMVLPENRRMVRVFTQAGFDASSAWEDGVIEVRFAIEPTEEARRVMEERAATADRRAVARLLEPRVVAVIGAGRDPGGIGHRVVRNVLAAGFTGAVHPVNPAAEAIAGVRAHARVGAIDQQVDLAVVCVPAADVAGVIEECGEAGVPAAVVISAGFAEAGPDGAVLQAEVLAVARRFGVRILGPNCLGIVNTAPDVSLHATFAEIATTPGPVGLLSQSGTQGAVILDHARRLGLGISSFVAVGNKSDLSGNDLLQFWLDDSRTEVVLLYLESFGNPRRFGRNVGRVARTKPVFAVRSGSALETAPDPAPDPAVDRAPGTGLDDATVDVLLRQTGVVRVPTVSALLHAALVASRQPIPTGNGVVVIGNSGGGSSMAADACVDAGLVLAELGATTRAVVDPLRLHGRSVANPVDLPFDATHEMHADVLEAAAVDASVDTVLVVHSPNDRHDADRFLAALDAVVARHPSTTFVACVYGDHPPVSRAGVPVFDFPDEAAHALGHVVRHGMWRAREGLGHILAVEDPGGLRRIVARHITGGGMSSLSPRVAQQLLVAGGVDPVVVEVLDGPDDVAGFSCLPAGRVAVKSHRHRAGAATQEDGVVLDLDTVEEVVEAAGAIAAARGEEAWPMIVQPMVTSGTNVRLEVRTHPVVGALARVGPGGAAARYADAARRVLPVSDVHARELVDGSELGEALGESAKEALVDLIRRACAIVDAAPEICELVCDPVIVRDDGLDVLDTWISLQRIREDPTPQVRTL